MDLESVKQDKAPAVLEMEVRKCKNDGCSKTFKVLKTSSQTACGASCAYGSQDDKTNFVKMLMRPMPKVQRPEVQKVIEKQKIIDEQRAVEAVQSISKIEVVKSSKVLDLSLAEQERLDVWRAYVDRAKKIVKRMTKDRIGIAKLAIEACDIKQGGGSHWSNFEGVYTLRRFADDIGVHYKTLHNWVTVKREIVDKLPAGMWDESNWGAALRTRNKITKKTSKKRLAEAYKKEAERNGSGLTFHTMVKRLSNARYYLVTDMNLASIDDEDAEKMEGICKDILQALEMRRQGAYDAKSEKVN